MTNYKQFYNSWMGFAKPKRELLLERTVVLAEIKPDDFLALTTDEEELKRIMDAPSIKEPFSAEKAGTLSLAIELDNSGNGKVVDHEGRNRAFAAKQAGLDKVPVNIIVTNKEGASFGEIKQFTAQFTPVVIRRIKLWTRDTSLDMSDPLKVGEGRDISGYSIKSQYDNEIDGLHHFIMKKFHSENALTNLGYDGLPRALTKAYTVVDSSGKTYSFEKNRVHPTGADRKTSLFHINLIPHPVEVHGSLEAANQQTYTIKKK